MRRRSLSPLLVATSLVGCGAQALPAPSVPDDPSTVQVIVFMRDQSGGGLHVWFPSTPDDAAGTDSAVTGGVAVACEVVPAGATVAVVTPPGIDRRLELYRAMPGAPDQVLWVETAPDGGLAHGVGRPPWGAPSPAC